MEDELSRRDFFILGSIAIGGLASNSAAGAKQTKAPHLISQKADSAKGEIEIDEYDVALYPMDEAFKKECIRFARVNLSDRADGYLLGEDAHPHVTLCLFKCGKERVSEIWSKVANLPNKSIELRFTHIYFSPDKNSNGAILWVGLAVKPREELSKLQKTVFDQLHELGIASLTNTEDYFPHLTWSRCRSKTPFSFAELPAPEVFQKSYPFAISLGRSDTNGVYHERLFI